MRHRIWTSGVVWSCLALAVSPCWAQGMMGGMGGGGGVDNTYGIQGFSGNDNGVPCTIDLKDATLGQVVEILQKANVVSENTPEPASILIPDKLKALHVGDIMLANVTPSVALASLSKASNGQFSIEAISDQVFLIRPAHDEVVVKAIRLPWMEPQSYAGGVMSEYPVSLTGGAALPTPEQQEEAIKKRQAEVEKKLSDLMKAIDDVFAMHAKVSGSPLPLPMINKQENLGMIMVVGKPESVEIASEIINATNPNHVRAASGGGYPGMGMPGGAGMPPEHMRAPTAAPASGGGGGGGFFSNPARR